MGISSVIVDVLDKAGTFVLSYTSVCLGAATLKGMSVMCRDRDVK